MGEGEMIRNLQDAQREIEALNSKIRRLETLDVDMSKRRVVNAAPSQNLDDYVIRRELEQFKKDVGSLRPTSSTSSSGNNYDCAVFGLGINTIIEVGTDVVPSHICVFPADTDTDRFEREAILLAGFVKCKQPPEGDEVLIEVWKNYGIQQVQNHPTERLIILEIPTGFDQITEYGPGFEIPFEVTKLINLDTIHLHISQVGSQVSGSGIYIKLLYKWL